MFDVGEYQKESGSGVGKHGRELKDILDRTVREGRMHMQ